MKYIRSCGPFYESVAPYLRQVIIWINADPREIDLGLIIFVVIATRNGLVPYLCQAII